jgi:hypothetical protein
MLLETILFLLVHIVRQNLEFMSFGRVDALFGLKIKNDLMISDNTDCVFVFELYFLSTNEFLLSAFGCLVNFIFFECCVFF